MTAAVDAGRLTGAIAEIGAAEPTAPRAARDPVNQPMIHNWVEAMGDRNPVYVDEAAARAAGHPGVVAPPAMIQVWMMRTLASSRAERDPLARLLELFDTAGYVGVVATNCEHTHHRYLRPGEQVTVSSELGEVTGPKQTALDEGWFINQHTIWWVDSKVVAEMNWRMLKFRPRRDETGPAPADLDPDTLMGPAVSRDTAFFWDGVAAHELRIQRRPDGSLQHPPVPAVWQGPEEGVAPSDYLVASGRGAVFSFVVHHAPKVPRRSLPFVIALVELAEGVRMLGELHNVHPGRHRDRNTFLRNIFGFPPRPPPARRGRFTRGSRHDASTQATTASRVGSEPQ